MSGVGQATLPRWDLSDLFPGPESPEFERALSELVEGIAELGALFDRLGIGPGGLGPGAAGSGLAAAAAGGGSLGATSGHAEASTAATRPTTGAGASTRGSAERGAESAGSAAKVAAAFDEATNALNAVLERARYLQAYLSLLISVDSNDQGAQRRLSELQLRALPLDELRDRWTAWLGTLDVEALIARSAVARDHAFVVRREAVRARHQLPLEQEALASTLSLSGGTAWAKLHGNLTSQIVVEVRIGDERRRLPMSEVRNLAEHPDRAVRRAAYEAELDAWRAHALPLAAALNGVKGEVGTLCARRGWPDPLEPALVDASIDRATLEAMHTAVRESFVDFRRYMRAKAALLGLERLTWFDLFAPLGPADAGDGARRWDWPAGTAFVERQFATFGEAMAALARRAFSDGWIDAEPRFGKRDGAFCMPLRADESRIMQNWTPTFDGVGTLAHELGHAYHNRCLAGCTALQRQTPMTLAETASTFCETLVENAYLEELQGPERLEFLEQRLRGLNQIVVDIHSRFLFESWVFERRARRELTPDECAELMLEAQRETYGDGLDPERLHPYMWAVKGHYYSPRRSFYNFPYTFGALFAIGLYARFRQEPATFRAAYDHLLASTGRADAAELAAPFGIDIRTPDFWRSSLDVARAGIDELVGLGGTTRPS